MAQPIVMPSFGMYTVEGTLLGWLHATGKAVEEGQPVLEIETEKATHEVLAPASGILHTIVAAGALIKEQDVVGYILAPGERPPAPAGAEPSPTAAASATAPAAARDRDVFVKASPIARRLAAEHHVDLATLTGSGPGGRIVEADVQAALARTPPREPQAAGSPLAEVKVRERVPLTGMRGAIAARLRRSVDTAVALTLTREVEAEVFVGARAQLAAALGTDVAVDALFVKLLALALRECPRLNAVVREQEILRLDDVNVGFAVSLPRGLVVPVIRGADTLALAAINEHVRALTDRARRGTIATAEMEGGTATVTNLGSHGIDAFTPVLNPPQSCILGIGRITRRAVVRGDAVVPGLTCVLSLTFDHRVEDGAPAAQMLETLARLMNDTALLVGLAGERGVEP
jgi:pyruvate dehydrogenase E2 component (dihydrolipoamide acetyltransferase)